MKKGIQFIISSWNEEFSKPENNPLITEIATDFYSALQNSESKINLRDLKRQIGEIFLSYRSAHALDGASSGVVGAGASAGGGSGAVIDAFGRYHPAPSAQTLPTYSGPPKDRNLEDKKGTRNQFEDGQNKGGEESARGNKRARVEEEPSPSPEAGDAAKLAAQQEAQGGVGRP